MSGWMGALGAMMQAGGGIYLKQGLEDKADEKKLAREKELQKIADESAKDRALAAKEIEAPSIQNIRRQGEDGNYINETIEQKWNKALNDGAGGYERKVISSYNEDKPLMRAESDNEMFARDPEGYKAKQQADAVSSRRGGGGGGRVGRDPAIAAAKSLNDRVIKSVAEFDKLEPADRDAKLGFYGIDPAASDARAKYENAKRAELTRQSSGQPAGESDALMKLPEASDEKKYPGFEQKNLKPGSNQFAAAMAELSTPETAPAAPAAPGTKPSPAPYPEGTKLVKDGKTYIVKNGEPVPYGG